jgi:chaperonin GroES|tara:strand:+ start:316 stop:606 length:291 start_codon:yes stop_codon:yes gene_type:complete
MNIRPLQDRIMIQPILEKEVRKGGIIIPDSAKEKPIEGRVKAVGEGKLNENGSRIELDVKVGDKVLYGKYAGTEIKIDGEDFLLMREDDILGVVVK